MTLAGVSILESYRFFCRRVYSQLKPSFHKIITSFNKMLGEQGVMNITELSEEENATLLLESFLPERYKGQIIFDYM